MSNTRTPEPWEIRIGAETCFHRGNLVSIVKTTYSGDEATEDEYHEETVAEVWPTDGDSDIEDGRRIVECVNGCAGISNPETTVPQAVSVIAEFLADQETMNEPFRNEAICERARQVMAQIGAPADSRGIRAIASMTVFLITAHETEGSVGFGPNFKPEIITDENKAKRRHAFLQDTRQPYSGIFYTLEPVELDAENEDY